MSFSRTNIAINALVQKHTNSTRNINSGITLLEVTPLKNEGFLRVTASVVKRDNIDSSALSAALDNKARVLEDTFSVVCSNSITDTISGIVSINPEIIFFDESVASEFKAVSSNMFIDTEEQIWSLKKTDNGKFLVKSMLSEDHDVLSDLMKSVSSAAHHSGTPEFVTLASANRELRTSYASIEGGDMVLFVNPNTSELCPGVVCSSVENADGTDAGLAVVSATCDEPIIIDRAMVTASLDSDEFEGTDFDDGDDFFSESGDQPSLEAIFSYYKKVYSRSEAFFEKFKSLWEQHRFF